MGVLKELLMELTLVWNSELATDAPWEVRTAADSAWGSE
jgi:hypothetical protein